jgi:hypothetical protein
VKPVALRVKRGGEGEWHWTGCGWDGALAAGWQADGPGGGGVSGAVWAVSPSSEGMPLPGRNFPTRTSEWLPTVYHVRIAATRGLRGCSAAMLSQPTPTRACLKIPRQDKTELGTC